VLSNGQLVGLITRSDLVRALAGVEFGKPMTRRADAAQQKALIEKIRTQSWLNHTYLVPLVNDGIVDLWGFIESDEQRKALFVLIEEVTGLRNIRDHTTRFGAAVDLDE
jgi:CBS domain-containing protein